MRYIQLCQRCRHNTDLQRKVEDAVIKQVSVQQHDMHMYINDVNLAVTCCDAASHDVHSPMYQIKCLKSQIDTLASFAPHACRLTKCYLEAVISIATPCHV